MPSIILKHSGSMPLAEAGQTAEDPDFKGICSLPAPGKAGSGSGIHAEEEKTEKNRTPFPCSQAAVFPAGRNAGIFPRLLFFQVNFHTAASGDPPGISAESKTGYGSFLSDPADCQSSFFPHGSLSSGVLQRNLEPGLSEMRAMQYGLLDPASDRINIVNGWLTIEKIQKEAAVQHGREKKPSELPSE